MPVEMSGTIGGVFQGGQRLGTAHGRIVIDTSSAQAAAAEMERVGQQVENSLGRRATSNLQNFSQGVRNLRGELAALGAISAGLTIFGYQAARGLRNFRIVFTQLLGDEAQAIALMQTLTERANDFGLEVREVWQLAQVLIPVLDDGVDGLDEWVVRAARLRTLNPFKTTTEALRAIQEYLADQPRSLQYLFNVNPAMIKEAKTAFEDLGDQIDYILRKRGATEEVAQGTADAWQSVRNELQLLIATGFLPLFQQLQPILRRLSQVLETIRQTSPALLTFGAAMVSVVAVGAPLLIFLGQVISSLEKIKALSVAGTLGRAGVGVAALTAGAFIGQEAVQAVGRATGREDLEGFQISDAWRTLRQAIVVVADIFIQGAGIVAKAIAWVARYLYQGFSQVIDVIGRFVRVFSTFISAVAEKIPNFLGGDLLSKVGDGLSQAGDKLVGWSDSLDESMGSIDNWVAQVNTNTENMRQAVFDFFTRFLGVSGPSRTGGFVPHPPEEPPELAFTGEQVEAVTEWAANIQDIERQAYADRIQSQVEYERQLSQTIEQYNQQQLREEEDFLRQRARQNDQLQKNIDRIWEDIARQEEEGQKEVDDRRAEEIEKSNKRIEDIIERHNQQMEKLERDHRRNVLEAAARLDASALVFEQMRYRDRRTDLQRDLDRRLAAEKENLQERLEQEQEAHEESLDKSREAAEIRIQRMKDDLAEQQRIEDEERAIRLGRIQQDHYAQLSEMSRAHAERMYQLEHQALIERLQLNAELRDRLVSLGVHYRDWLQLQEEKQEDSLDLFEEFFGSIQEILTPAPTVNPPTQYGGHQRGGIVDYTGYGMLHGSRTRPEYVLNPETTAALRSMIGNFNQSQLLSAVAGGTTGESRSFTIQSGAINMPIYAQPGQSTEDIAQMVQIKLAELFQGAVQ